MILKLKEKTLNALFWAFFDAVGLQAIQFIIVIFLARILEPVEFGLIAMITVFISICSSFIDSGFSSALIQKKNASYVDENSIFYFTIIMGVITALLFWFSSISIASFYNEPRLISLSKVLSLTLFIDSLGNIHYTLFKKSVDFKTLTKISFISSLASGIVSIIMAFNGFGVWSLVVFILVNKSFRLILYWYLSTWKPALMFSLSSLRSMFRYGSNILLIGLLNNIFNNIYLLVIGKLFSATDLGYYSRAKSLQYVPVQNIAAISSRVTFPIFSKIQNDKTTLTRGLKKSISTIALITFPIMIGIFVTAKPLVIVLLSNKWLPSVIYLKLLCGVGLFYPLNRINLDTIKAIGLSNLLLKLQLLKKIMIVFAIFITYQWGIEAMIYGQIIVHFFSYIFNLHHTSKYVNFRLFDQIKDICFSFILSLIMGVIIYFFNYFDLSNQFLLLLLQSFSGLFIYITLCYFLKLPAFLELYNIIKSKIT